MKVAAQSFLPAANYSAGANPRSITIGDFDGDGKLDLAIGNQNSNGSNISVLIGTGDGTFQTAVGYMAGVNPISLATADFNGDGKLDLVSANDSSSNVSVLLGNGNGTFQNAVNYSFSGSRPTSITTGDFNTDGKLDIAIVTAAKLAGQTSNVSVLFGNGNGTFQFGGSYVVGDNPQSLTVGDFNGDSKLDIATANFGFNSIGGNNVSVILGNGDGTFQPVVNYYAGTFPFYIVTADLNHDGKLDLAVANFGSGSNNVSVLLGNGDGTFRAAINYFADTNPSSIAVGDFNADGNLDLATANAGTSAPGGNNVSILFGKGDGTFQNRIVYYAGANPTALTTGDFNRDGKPDLAVVNLNGNNVSVLLSSLSPTAVYTISGRVTDISGNGINGVTIKASNSQTGQSGTTQTDASGNYSFNSSVAADTVTPSKPGYTFDPPGVRCVSSRGSCGNFTRDFIGATQAYAISGKVLDGNGNGISDVLLQLVSSNNLIMRPAFTDASGNYSFAGVLAGGSYKVTPSKTGYSFNFPYFNVSNLSANRTLFPFTGTTRPYTISGQVKDASGNGVGNVDLILTRPGDLQGFGTITDASGLYSIRNIAGEGTYTLTPSKDGFTFNPQSLPFSNPVGNQTANFVTTLASTTLQFSAANFTVGESDGHATITVTRGGDLSATASVSYTTSDTAGLSDCNIAYSGKASARCDYATTLGTLTFAAGQSTATFQVPIVNDAHVEGTETFSVNLSNPVGAMLNTQKTAIITILDNDTSASTNPVDGIPFFVRQQYLDFFSREPDTTGYQNWLGTLQSCPNGGYGEFDNAACDRVHVSAAFYQSDEFQSRGYFVYRFYQVGLGGRPTYAEFIPDMVRIGGSQSPEQEAASKAAYTAEFVQRAEFTAKYNQAQYADPSAYVRELERVAGVTVANEAQLISDLQTGVKTRAQTLCVIAESTEVFNKYFNQGFVAMQYFGYLRRDPDTLGFANWVQTLDTSGDYRHMIFGFMYSAEYRSRFGTP